MKQLSEQDAAFIYSDNAHANSNVTLLHIYDQTTAPGGLVRFKQIRAHVESRLEQLPVFREKILRVPFDIDRPYWTADESFDINYHVRHIALPKPGDWRQFCIQVSRLHARPLDLQRPLWEMYVIEGLDSLLDLPAGSFAVLVKVHHAAVDVTTGNTITTLLHDPSPQPRPATPAAPWFPVEAPGSTALLMRAWFNMLSFPMRMAPPMLRNWTALRAAANTLMGDLMGRSQIFPMTRFNTEVSSQRVFDTRRFPLADFKAMRQLVEGASVNDVVLAVCAGGLRRYLDLQGELPDTSLVTATPVGVRPSAADPGPAQFAWVQLKLATHLADPVERLGTIRAYSASSDVMSRAVGAQELQTLAQHAPAAAVAVTSKLLRSASNQLGNWVPLANCAITNIPGPDVPLYLLGAKLTYVSAIMPVTDGMGLGYAVTSYNGLLVISFTACAEQMPDPDVFAQCLRDSFQEYLSLLPPAPAARPVRPRRKPAKKRSITAD
ncbi:MAG TPA: wax ester/triacylglycerol synthase family O-acyltransferase [Burkholderiaceae bacterium]|nr:wax ester/triacylglycerol synthase family O-acyltransferase [Burkholderiaceae bacterium]